MNRPPLTKFKGSEDLQRICLHVVFMVKNNSGSGFVIDFKGKNHN